MPPRRCFWASTTSRRTADDVPTPRPGGGCCAAHGSEPRGLAIATVEADAFCHGMVRSLVGAFLAVGEGRRAIDWPAQVLEAGVRDSAVQVVAPHGLTLEEVCYPPDEALAARAEETRRRGRYDACQNLVRSVDRCISATTSADAARGSSTRAIANAWTRACPADGMTLTRRSITNSDAVTAAA